MQRYSVKPRTGKCVKGHGFLSFSKKNLKQLLNTGLMFPKKMVYEAGEFIGNKILDTVTR